LGRLLAVRLLLTIFALGPWAAPCAYAATITVNSTNMTLPPSTDGQCTLIEAMESANGQGLWPDCAAGSAGGNVIELQVGQTYTLLEARIPSALGLPIVSRPLTINGHGSIITRSPSSGAFRLLYVLLTSLTLNDLTIQSIVLPEQGDGAVYNDNGTLIINRSTVKGTRALGGGTGGGAITSRACAIAAIGCSGNRASLLVVDSAFDDNESRSTSNGFGAGAGINTFAVGNGAVNTTTILRSRFHANTATNQGAGVSNSAYNAGATSTTTITQSSITGNTATGGSSWPGFGGGLANFTGGTGGAANSVATMTITNTTIAANSAIDGNGFGGGIFNELDCAPMSSCGGGAAVHLSLNAVTIVGNVSGHGGNSGTQGAGIWTNSNDPSGTVDFTVRDSLIAGNLANGTPGNCRVIHTALTQIGYNIASDSSCGDQFNVFSDAQINLAPLNFSNFTYYRAPQAGSAAIDRTACNVTVDQLGTTRPGGASCDVGAIEANAANSLLVNFGAGSGVWTRSGSSVWSSVHSSSPRLMTVGDLDGNGIDEMIFDFGAANGLWVYYNKTTWAQFGQVSPSVLATADLDHDGRDDLIVGFPGYGTYVFYNNTTWQWVTNYVATRVAAGNVDGTLGDDLVVDLPGAGIWMLRNNSAWLQLHPAASNALVVADIDGSGKADVIISFPGQGIWSYRNDAGWVQIHSTSSTHIAAGNLNGNASKDLVIDFGAAGLWIYRDASVFQSLHPFAAEQVVIGDFDGNGLDDIAIDFGANYGLWLWTNNAWTQLHSVSPVDITFTDLK
jgi:hypothetical protein